MDRYGETSHDCMEASVGALDVSKPSPWCQVNERSRGCGSAGAIVGPPARAGGSDAGTCLEVGTALVVAPSAGAGPVIIRVARLPAHTAVVYPARLGLLVSPSDHGREED